MRWNRALALLSCVALAGLVPTSAACTVARADAETRHDAGPGSAPSAATTLASAPAVGSSGMAPATPPLTLLPPSTRDIGPYELPFLSKRSVFFVVPSSSSPPHPLIANLHGLCNPPSYACGYWSHAASQVGFLVCPSGNASCGPGAYNAPTWTESYAQMGDDLDAAVRTIEDAYPGEVNEEGAVLTGFSMGAYAAPVIAARHPGRWRYLILNEADVTLRADALRRAGVRAVALIAGDRGSQLAGERKTCDALVKSGFPARLWIMPNAGHYYSANIDAIMGEALAFVLSHGDDARTPAAQ